MKTNHVSKLLFVVRRRKFARYCIVREMACDSTATPTHSRAPHSWSRNSAPVRQHTPATRTLGELPNPSFPQKRESTGESHSPHKGSFVRKDTWLYKSSNNSSVSSIFRQTLHSEKACDRKPQDCHTSTNARTALSTSSRSRALTSFPVSPSTFSTTQQICPALRLSSE